MKHWAKTEVRLNLHEIIERAVEEGIAYGWNRAHKHVDEPDAEAIKDQIHTAVMGALYEVISWGDE
jgi:hypothetical protein